MDNSNYSPFINPDGETRSRRYTGTAHDGVSEIGGRLSVQPRKSLPITLSVGGGYERKTESPFVSGAIGFVTGTSVRLHVDAELTRYAVYYEDNTVIEESGHITFATVNGYGTEWAKRNAISTSIEVPIGH